jgi:hypothetical protein
MLIYIMCTCKEGALQSSCRILNRNGHSHVYVLEISKFPMRTKINIDGHAYYSDRLSRKMVANMLDGNMQLITYDNASGR